MPLRKQRELERVVEILHEEFDTDMRGATSPKKRRGRILRMVLFGSHARGTWVEDRGSGYFSDYDIMVIVNEENLVRGIEAWARAEDRFLTDPRIKPMVQVIVHSLHEINQHLSLGQFFFSDIRDEGIALYEAHDAKPLKQPHVLTPEQALAAAEQHYEKWLPDAQKLKALSEHSLAQDWFNQTAFLLHQATESAFHGYLLVHTNYTPATHNILHLRGLCEDIDITLSEVFPRAQKLDRTRYQNLKDAYIKSRYSPHFKTSVEELTWLGERVADLLERVEAGCKARIEVLRQAVG